MVKRTVSAGSRVVVASDPISSDLGDEVAILNFKAGMYYGLDEVGARVWSLIQEPKTVEEIREVLVNEYEVEPDLCEHDLISLLQRLADEELVEITDATST